MGVSPPARLCVTSAGDCPPKVKMNNELSQSPKCRDWLFYVGLGWILGEWSICFGKRLICGGKRSINLRKWTKSSFKWMITSQKRSICGFFYKEYLLAQVAGTVPRHGDAVL